ncbi:pantoate--beta-alanine ligase [Paramicrobacterium chengjingii]|uniref:Pantothenate synthetase n=1 Tax=Paramicrobacterium chengjingii TaxID=2769067 RepID=A0ABX6YH00_9MICO|nr:pantoate--beta-alanine ligase [Microbacterium chengjingii]QPZ37667.1 pantoate--beta-alanine ligase [Microbacterium chengjingii]
MTQVADTRGLNAWRNATRGTVALVPTMGALHDGHRRLIAHAHGEADAVAVSIFVNPLQFGPDEDFERYPRDLDSDLEICRADGVDVVFAPELHEMYPRDPEVTVSAGRMGAVFEGASRPGHFDGVLTVVAKLFQRVRPDVAIFGQKDAQQLALVERLVADLDLGVHIESVPIVRDADGLALSSRNRYLSAAERESALALPRALEAAAHEATTAASAQDAARRTLADAELQHPELSLDYATLVDRATFTKCSPDFRGDAVLVLAARVGATRVIDNATLTFG